MSVYGTEIRQQIEVISEGYWKIPRNIVTEYIGRLQELMSHKQAAITLYNPSRSLVRRHGHVCTVHEPLSAYKVVTYLHEHPEYVTRPIEITSFRTKELKARIRYRFGEEYIPLVNGQYMADHTT